jgi:pyruvate-formate lyase
MKKEFLKISQEILDVSEKYRDLDDPRANDIADLFQEIFIAYLSIIKSYKDGVSKEELKETIYNVLFGEVKKYDINLNNIDMDLLNEIKSSINDL